MPKAITVTNTLKAQNIITSFTSDIVELVRESILEEVEGILLERFEAQQTKALPAPRAGKQLAAKPRAKELKPRVRIKATADKVQVLNA